MAVDAAEARAALEERFAEAGLPSPGVVTRLLPDEAILVVTVEPAHLAEAASIAAELETTFAEAQAPVFVSVRRAEPSPKPVSTTALSEGVRDERALALRQLISARSRTSEVQPSLAYVPDAAMNVASVIAPRHHLIFGRRGAGKTALMVEAKRRVSEGGHLTAWLNIQTYRNEPVERVFLYFASQVCDTIAIHETSSADRAPSAQAVSRLRSVVAETLSRPFTEFSEVERLVPQVHDVIRRSLISRSARLYIFLDDFYYLRRADQAPLLDMIHSCVRDTDAWLKVASIRNLTKWFLTSPPTGLQTGQDADLIDLDVTLQDPTRAKEFLESVLQKYAEEVGIRSLTTVFSKKALDRLVLASGGVPRDYLVLAGSAIIKTRARESGRLVGAQDVNQAAGDAAQVKILELEDDVASNTGIAEQTTSALPRVRSFCLDQKGFTYFRVDFRDKERNPDAYAILSRLVEFRLVHIVANSVSEAHIAGERSEVFMLDLSQFSGARLKHKIRVIDLVNGVMVSRKTREGGAERIATTPRELLSIYRVAPLFELFRFSDLVSRYEPIRSAVLRVLQAGVTRTGPELVAELHAPYKELRVSLADLVQEGAVEEILADGRPVYRLAAVTEQSRLEI